MIYVSMTYKHEIKGFQAIIMTFMANFLFKLLLMQYELDLYIQTIALLNIDVLNGMLYEFSTLYCVYW